MIAVSFVQILLDPISAVAILATDYPQIGTTVQVYSHNKYA